MTPVRSQVYAVFMGKGSSSVRITIRRPGSYSVIAYVQARRLPRKRATKPGLGADVLPSDPVLVGLVAAELEGLGERRGS